MTTSPRPAPSASEKLRELERDLLDVIDELRELQPGLRDGQLVAALVALSAIEETLSEVRATLK